MLGSRQQDVREMAKEFNKRFDGRGGGKPEMDSGNSPRRERSDRAMAEKYDDCLYIGNSEVINKKNDTKHLKCYKNIKSVEKMRVICYYLFDSES